MVELIIATYGGLCYLLFARFKVIPVNTYTVVTAILGGVVILGALWGMLAICHPASQNARLYSPVVQIVPEVRGRVIDVPIEGNQPIKAGEVLFRIDPKPYQIEVDRLQAILASKNLKVAQLKQELAAAEAAIRGAEAALLVSESEQDRQLRQQIESASAKVAQVEDRLEFARSQAARDRQLVEQQAISREQYERGQASVESKEDELEAAKSEKDRLMERLSVGDSVVQTSREEIRRAEAQAEKIRLALNAESEGMNPEVRETMALLDQARLDLANCVVRAPTDGYVPNLVLKPGQMATPLPLNPLMVFVSGDDPLLVAMFPQNVIGGFEPGLEAEIAFKSRPGRVFQARVKHVVLMIREGELDVSGKLLAGTPANVHGQVPVILEYEEDLASENLQTGALGTVAVYTHNLHVLGILRKIVLRIKSWENYLFFLPMPGH